MTPRDVQLTVFAVALVAGIVIGTYAAFATQSDPASTTPAASATPAAAAAPAAEAPGIPPPVGPDGSVPSTPLPFTPPPAGTTSTQTGGLTTAPPAPSTRRTAPPPAAATPPAAPTTTGPRGTSTSTTSTTAKPTAIALDADAASIYNPGGAPAASFGRASKAIDGNPLTAWSFKLDRATAGVTSAGVALDLSSARRVAAIKIDTTTPGMTIAVYGAEDKLPATIDDPAWVKLAGRASTPTSATLELDADDRKLRHVLVLVTRAPPGVNIGSVTICELSITSG